MPATFFTLVDDRIEKIDPKTGCVLAYEAAIGGAPVTATGRSLMADGKQPLVGGRWSARPGKSRSRKFGSQPTASSQGNADYVRALVARAAG